MHIPCIKHVTRVIPTNCTHILSYMFLLKENQTQMTTNVQTYGYIIVNYTEYTNTGYRNNISVI